MVEPSTNGDDKSKTSAALSSVIAFTERLEQSTRNLFGNSSLSERICDIGRQLREECQRLAERAEASTPTLAILGKVGEGKSWLARCFLMPDADNGGIREELMPGQSTQRLLWFGPERPMGLGDGEQYRTVHAPRMLNLERQYIVGDTPGFSQQDVAAAQLSHVAVSSAAIKLVVLSAESLRDGAIGRFIGNMPGAVVMPVVRFRPSEPGAPDPDTETLQDVHRQCDNWRTAAPETTVLDPLFVPDQDKFSPDDPEKAVVVVRERLQSALVPQLEQARQLADAVEHEMMARCRAAEQKIRGALQEFGKRVGPAFEKVNRIGQELPSRLVRELIGDDLLVRTGVRRRFRAEWLDRTPAWCFPYRSFLGLLALTAGAWDRLVFSMLGSVPSLALTFFQSIKNLREGQAFAEQMRTAVAQRLERLIENEVRADYGTLVASLRAVLPERANSPSLPSTCAVRVFGLERIEAESREILQAEIDRYGPGRRVPWLFAAAGAAAFWALLAGPIVTLYGEYLSASWRAVGAATASWMDFPTPSPGMLLGSLLLSAAPVFVLALVALGWGCRSSQVDAAVRAITETHQRTISQRHASGALRIELEDPLLDDARFLLELGAKPSGSIR